MLELKQSLLFYIKNLYTIDFVFALLVLFIFVSLLLPAVIFHQRPIIAFLFIFFDIVSCCVFAYFGYKLIDDRVRTRTVELVDENFYGGSNFVIDVNIKNQSKYNFSHCKIIAKIYNTNSDANLSTLEKYKQSYIPIRLKSKSIEKPLAKNEAQSHRIKFDNFNKDMNYSIKLESECF